MDIPESHLFDFDSLDRETIEAYIADLREAPPASELEARLNDERERARRQCVRGVHEWVQTGSQRLRRSRSPTGLGKTFTGLSAAFELRDSLADRETAESARQIIYALPYTSIIEQTRELFEDPELWGADPEKSALTVHHYLSETVVHHDDYDAGDTAATDDEETASMLGEAWRDGTVLTTFVQLFESLAGPTNRQGLKLPSLESSIIILDEPQALPKDWWGAIQRLLDIDRRIRSTSHRDDGNAANARQGPGDRLVTGRWISPQFGKLRPVPRSPRLRDSTPASSETSVLLRS